MDDIAIDWSSAEVRDGTLEIGLSDTPPRGWKGNFDRTLKLLPGGDWGTVNVRKSRIRVRDVSPGSEDRLRHFLESVVTQANATHERGSAGEERQRKAEQLQGPDAEMTGRFRSFGEGQAD